jgi:hypothetical protein
MPAEAILESVPVAPKSARHFDKHLILQIEPRQVIGADSRLAERNHSTAETSARRRHRNAFSSGCSRCLSLDFI